MTPTTATRAPHLSRTTTHLHKALTCTHADIRVSCHQPTPREPPALEHRLLLARHETLHYRRGDALAA